VYSEARTTRVSKLIVISILKKGKEIMIKPIVLCICDGVGIAPASESNAVSLADMPFFKNALANCPNTELDASGNAVGLPAGVMGNSEVGHITIGAGRIDNQFLRRFEIASKNGEITNSPALKTFLNNSKNIHIIGLMSDGNVHSSITDTIFMAHIFLNAGKKVYLHFIADGRDVPPKSAQIFIDQLQSEFANEIENKQFKFATLSGRYYAMDRNNNWDRTKLAYDTICYGSIGDKEYNPNVDLSITAALDHAYAANETDEFIKPTAMADYNGIAENDGVFIANYRADRTRQILAALSAPTFDKFPRDFVIKNVLSMTSLGAESDAYCPALLPHEELKNTLGDVLNEHNLRQLRIAETEKYNHVTYFFDAERKICFPAEEQILIPSPFVATYDLKPEMSAVEITDKLLEKLPEFDVVILNFANGDMVGHTANINATVRAMETLDECLARINAATLKLGGAMLITADHGNAEQLRDSNGGEWTAHTTNTVPFILISDELKDVKLHTGGLSDIAPTILDLLNIKKPNEMTGHTLIEK
jgi:2,3-bisphosphoglycerate-independent phosphoglycerate mutase